MNVHKVNVLFLLLLFTSTATHGSERNAADPPLSGFGFEVLLTKLEHLYDKVAQVESGMQKTRESTEKKLNEVIAQLNQTIHEKLNGAITTLQTQSNVAMKKEREYTDIKLSTITDAINQMSATTKQKLSETISQLQLEGIEVLYKHILWANHEQMRKEIQTVKSTEDFAQLKSQSGHQLRHISLKSCKDNPSKQYGKFILQSDTKDKLFLGFCTSTRFGGGWLEIQFRTDGTVNFTRNWTDYRDGFGNYDGEHWIGLELLHRLTSSRPHELFLYLQDFDGNDKYARYSEFEIGSETEQYALKKLGGYSGTAGDSLSIHKGMKFSTWDRDNDLNTGNCASKWKGGWWYKDCYDSNLNGVHGKGNDWENIVWKQYSSSNNNMGLKLSRMLIRET